jgi:hypothetical protein|tara:strand:+ start:258 stop:434 length:177 start_codon:yes stop_codon:yes gene_type:complete
MSDLRKLFESFNPSNPASRSHRIHMATCYEMINNNDDEENIIDVQHEEIDEDEYPLGI